MASWSYRTMCDASRRRRRFNGTMMALGDSGVTGDDSLLSLVPRSGFHYKICSEDYEYDCVRPQKFRLRDHSPTKPPYLPTSTP